MRGSRLYESPPEGEVIDLEGFSSLQEVRQVKVADVVANDDIRIRLHYEISPPLQICRLAIVMTAEVHNLCIVVCQRMP